MPRPKIAPETIATWLLIGGIAWLAILMLASCAAMPGQPTYRCPPLKAYSKLEQDVASDELRSLPPENTEIRQMLDDYLALRQACRGGQ